MPFAAAFSAHPISSFATGEVVGRLFETAGAGPDVVVLLATPGHRGALDDIVATARRLLSPAVLLAAVTSGLGTGEDVVEGGPGLVAWSGICGPVAAVGPGCSRPPFEPSGLLILGGPGAAPGASLGGAWPGAPVVAGTVDGPVVVDGTVPGRGPVGVAFGPHSGFGAAVVHGLRRVGPDLVITRAEGTIVYELDGRPAFDRLVEVARDGMPAAELSSLAARLHLAATGPAGRRDPSPVLGADRANGALAVGDPVEGGMTVHFAVTDPGTVRAALGQSIAPGSEGAVVLAPAGWDRLFGAGPGRTDPCAPPGAPARPSLPLATLVCATVGPPVATQGRSAPPTAAVMAFFSPSIPPAAGSK